MLFPGDDISNHLKQCVEAVLQGNQFSDDKVCSKNNTSVLLNGLSPALMLSIYRKVDFRCMTGGSVDGGLHRLMHEAIELPRPLLQIHHNLHHHAKDW